ncbi:MAG: ribonuclease P protein subunit [Candidatus Altiarchaeota archaeon]|nr:ribonuclease P protein subunit [Candidatus Altiarchaeota archaeon]
MIIEDELIGLSVLIETSTDPKKHGIAGRVVDETKNMLTIDTKDGIKKVAKGECDFVFMYMGEQIQVEGKLIMGRPEDRIKKGKHWSKKWRLPKFFFK